MTVLVYGAGAVGLGLASCLLRAGVRVDLVGRKATVRALRRYGLLRTGIFGSFHADSSQFGAFGSMDELCPQEYDCVLVCVKSFASEEAADDIAAHEAVLPGSPVIVLCQNGWGNAQIFTSRFAEHQVFNARVITGFERPEPHTVVVTVHADAIHIGSLFHADISLVEALCNGIETGGIPCRTTEEIAKDLWAKMLYNCALNPLGAILDCPYGVLADNASTRWLMDRIVRETFAVMEAGGYQTHYRDPEAFLDAFYSRLVPDTAGHRSSTLQDIRAGRQTEIDALNGAVIRLADVHDMEVPHNAAVYNLVKFLETGR